MEEQFYLLAPIAIRLISVRRLTALLFAIVFAAPFLRFAIYTWLPNHSYLAGFAMPCRADALALGILAAIGWRREGFRQMLETRRALLWGAVGFGFLVIAMLSPTFVRTPQGARFLTDPAFRQSVLARIPLGRLGETDDIAAAVLFFSSPASDFITGQTLYVDGGVTATQ